MKITVLNNTCDRIGAFPWTFFLDQDNNAIILIHKTKKNPSKSLNLIKTIQIKRFNHRTFIFFQKEEKSTFSGKDCQGGGNNSGTMCEAGAFKYSCWRLYTSQEAFSTAPAEDLTQICLNHKFQKEYINNREGKTLLVKDTFRFFQLLASSSICEVRN